MRIHRIAVVGALTLLGAFAASIIPGDARRGKELFEAESCIKCHSINGKGGTVGPDLGRRVDRNYTPAVLASTMWNHAPAMWSAMRERGIQRPVLPPQGAADLFAFFFSARFFEKPGDASRGKQLFSAHHCSGCHGITNSVAENAPPVSKWESLGDPIILVQQMWNHATQMRAAFARRKIGWQKLTSQELTDILVYLQNLPETKQLAANFAFPPAEAGQALFESKCMKCHVGKLALENRLRNQTITDIAVDMWNHAPKMAGKAPTLNQEEMREVVTHVWARQFFRNQGNPGRGQKVYQEKKCVVCHSDSTSGAPSLAARKGNFSDIFMIAALWEHGPRMLDRMRQKGVNWPRFEGSQMSDLIAYLNSR